jgi:hypothetical protein
MDLNHRPHAYQACALNHLSYRPYTFCTLQREIYFTIECAICQLLFTVKSRLDQKPDYLSGFGYFTIFLTSFSAMIVSGSSPRSAHIAKA